MCVRYTLHKSDAALGAISRALGEPLEPWEGPPRYNATLTDVMPVVALRDGKAATLGMRWGLIGSGSPRPRLFANARSETARSLPAFKNAVSGRRCLVPANGFYEWEEKEGQKLPHLFTLKDEQPFAFAGIWDPPQGDLPATFCVLTTVPNGLLAAFHDRMPVLLCEGALKQWIGGSPLGDEDYKALCQPFSEDRMRSRRVSRYMSNSRNEGPQCLEPPEESPQSEFSFG